MMISAKIMIPTVADIKEFVNIMHDCAADVELRSGKFVVDAKSLMGIFSLDLENPVTIVFPVEAEPFMKSRVIDKWGVK